VIATLLNRKNIIAFFTQVPLSAKPQPIDTPDASSSSTGRADTKHPLWSHIKEAGWVFLLSRFVLLFITYFTANIFPNSKQNTVQDCVKNFTPCLTTWRYYDATAYTRIAYTGYKLIKDTAFFPLWPALIRIFSFPFHPSMVTDYLVGVALSNICFFVALVLLSILVAKDFDTTTARRSLFLLAFAPFGLFFFAGYTESLFIMLSLVCFLSLQQDRAWGWWIAGLAGLLASLTRSTGLFLGVPYLVFYLQRYWFGRGRHDTSWLKKINALLPIALIPVGTLIFMVYLYITKGNPLIFSHEEDIIWGRHLAFPGTGIITVLYYMHVDRTFPPIYILYLVLTLIGIIVMILGWRKLPLHYNLFTLVVMIFTLSYPLNKVDALTSMPRYILVLFPITISFALWSKNERLYQLFLACAIPCFTLATMIFIRHYTIA
jgi:hypothetical protein